MRAVPGQVRPFDIPGLDSSHFGIIVVRSLSRRGFNGHVLRDPLPIVPLADESTPILDSQVDVVISSLEARFLVAFGRCGQHIDAVVVARGQFDRLALGHNRVGRGICWEREVELRITTRDFRGQCRRCKMKPHIIKSDLRGQHLRRHGVAFAIKSIAGVSAIVTGNRNVVFQ